MINKIIIIIGLFGIILIGIGILLSSIIDKNEIKYQCSKEYNLSGKQYKKVRLYDINVNDNKVKTYNIIEQYYFDSHESMSNFEDFIQYNPINSIINKEKLMLEFNFGNTMDTKILKNGINETIKILELEGYSCNRN